MAKRSKNEKRKRLEGAIGGIRKYFDAKRPLHIGQKAYKPEELIAIFEEHLRALAEVDEITIQRGIAIQKERATESRTAPLIAAVKSLAVAAFTAQGPELRWFGMEPDKKPHMTPETKLIANEKRQATRKERRVMGRRQRQRAKKGE